MPADRSPETVAREIVERWRIAYRDPDTKHYGSLMTDIADALVAFADEKVKEEREACAIIADREAEAIDRITPKDGHHAASLVSAHSVAFGLAAAIRSRKGAG